MKKSDYDVIIVGAGFAGSVLAREFAEIGKKVLVVEKRNHIAGNMYEKYLDNGVRIHLYGPHIFHTSNKKVFDYVKKYSEWFFYEHRVVGKIDNILVPIPFNFKSLELLFTKEKADYIKEKLISKYPNENKISILDLINNEDATISEFGKYVYDKVFVHYTAKQWNIPIEQVDTSVINRVPVILGYDDRYFQDTYQYMPKYGYTKLFENLLNHKNITVKLNIKAQEVLSIDTNNKKVLFNRKEFNGITIFTGALDDLLNYQYGPLPYRSLNLVFESFPLNYYQSNSVVNYPNEEKYTRITEFKYLSNELVDNHTTILKEYPVQYDYKNSKTDPYYAIINEENNNLYSKYYDLVKDIPNFYLCGRLAEYKYYNMDAVIEKALELFERIKK